MKKITEMPTIMGDVVRFLADILIHSLAFLAGALVFLALWRTGSVWARVLAFPAAYGTLAVAFPLVVMVMGLLFVRRIAPGRYSIRAPEALPWIVAESLVLTVHRSFLRGYVDDFGPQRYLFHRILGGRIDYRAFVGGEARILDPWVLEVGRNALIGAFSVICGHSLEGDTLIIEPVKIGEGATIGVRSVILPGVEVGKGAIVGAGALVTKGTRIPPHEIWAGVPARKIGVVSPNRTEQAQAREAALTGSEQPVHPSDLTEAR